MTMPHTGPLRVALFGLHGSGNLGNEGSLQAMLRFLRERHPDAQVTCVCPGPEEVEERHGVAAMSMFWYRSEDVRRFTPGIVARKSLGKIADAVRTMRWVRGFDVVVVPGSGAFETTLPTRPWGFPYALLLVALAGRIHRTKVAFVSVGAHCSGQPVTGWVMAMAARLAHFRSFRDSLSRDTMRRLGVDTTSDQVCPDLVFGLPAASGGGGETKTVGVGVMAYYGTHLDRRRADELHATYVAKMTRFVRWLVDNGHRVRLFVGDRVDGKVASTILTDLRSTHPSVSEDRVRAEQTPSFDELVTEMSRVDAMVASRYHNVLCALTLLKPTVAVGYSAKSDVLMAETGLGEYCQSIRSLDVDRLIAQFESLLARRDELERGIRERNDENAALVDRQFGVLSSTLFAAATSESTHVDQGA